MAPPPSPSVMSAPGRVRRVWRGRRLRHRCRPSGGVTPCRGRDMSRRVAEASWLQTRYAAAGAAGFAPPPPPRVPAPPKFVPRPEPVHERMGTLPFLRRRRRRWIQGGLVPYLVEPPALPVRRGFAPPSPPVQPRFAPPRRSRRWGSGRRRITNEHSLGGSGCCAVNSDPLGSRHEADGCIGGYGRRWERSDTAYLRPGDRAISRYDHRPLPHLRQARCRRDGDCLLRPGTSYERTGMRDGSVRGP